MINGFRLTFAVRSFIIVTFLWEKLRRVLWVGMEGHLWIFLQVHALKRTTSGYVGLGICFLKQFGGEYVALQSNHKTLRQCKIIESFVVDCTATYRKNQDRRENRKAKETRKKGKIKKQEKKKRYRNKKIRKDKETRKNFKLSTEHMWLKMNRGSPSTNISRVLTHPSACNTTLWHSSGLSQQLTLAFLASCCLHASLQEIRLAVASVTGSHLLFCYIIVFLNIISSAATDEYFTFSPGYHRLL